RGVALVTESSAAPTAYRRRDRSRKPLVIALIAAAAVIAVAAVALVLNLRGGGTDGGRQLSVGVVLEPTSLDVRTNTGVATGQLLIDNVYQGLVGIEAGTVADIVPVLATELPEVSEDGLEYTFTLREGVKFHSGGELTADDVVSSLQETLTAENIGFAPEVAKVDDRTVSITLDEPNSQLLWHLANFPGLIREQGADNNLADSAIGTGPYVFEEWKQGDSLTLVKNEDYWGEPASLDTVVFRFFPEGRAAVNALKEGDLDVHTALLPPLRGEFEHDDAFTLQRAGSSDVFTLAFNSARAPLDDPQVRTAISRAIDTEALIASQNGDGKPLGSPITELEPGYADLTSVNAFDPDSARQLLAEAGQSNLNLTITAPNHYDTAPLDLVKSQLADVGVSLTIEQVEFPTWIEQVYSNHDYQLSYVDHAEARDFANYANPDYYFGYDSSAVQKLYADALAATDPADEDRLLREAAAQVAEDAPAKWLFNYTPTNVVSKRVGGFPEANTNSRINLQGVSVG
ncbi:MAG: ABC transporter substrate-binding protein, partial [Leucobacter sp.]